MLIQFVLCGVYVLKLMQFDFDPVFHFPANKRGSRFLSIAFERQESNNMF